MARKPMVTRTIVTTKVNVLCMDLEHTEPCNKEVTLPRTFKDDKKLFKAVQDVVDSKKLKAVQVVDSEEVETLYGMSEQDFIDNAMKLDNETRRPIEDGIGTEQAREQAYDEALNDIPQDEQ